MHVDLHHISAAQVRVSRTLRGTERYVLELCRHLQVRGHTPTIISKPGGELAAAARALHYPCQTPNIRGDLNVMTPMRIAEALKLLDANLMNMHGGHGAFLCCLGARKAGIPSICTIHSLHHKWGFLSATHLIAVSEQVRQHLRSQGIRPERITLVRNGVDVHHFTPGDRIAARHALNLNPDCFYFAAVAMLVKGKGLSLLLHAIQYLRDRNPRVHLLIAGTGPLESDLRAQTSRLGLDESVHFLGFQTEIRPIYAAADCLVLPSEREGLPLSVLEAMACARATIATDVGGTREVLRDGKTGLLIPAMDGSALSEAMLRLANDPALAHEYGVTARQYALTEHVIERQIDDTLAVYSQVLS